MKLTKLFVVLAALSVTVAAKSEERAEKALDVKTSLRGVSVAKAKYTLINFWSNSDAASKASVASLAKELKNAKTAKIEMVAVAFEPLKLAYETSDIAKDDVYGDAYKTYKVRKSLSNYLVDASGKVVARDLTPESLAFYINEVK
ncbi:hypothetical protein [Parabacteroides sp. FAFU027]|uniref:hypothetical protein n=1 Tax=Parabacteroides sp. FAFU027 TaxID=2922715 RepID=UPI001FAFA273|nr:hypothetical protein [Parabacteroides sp. FAFU027]